MRRRRRVLEIVGVAAAAALIGVFAGRALAKGPAELTDAAAEAVKRVFPDATVMEVGREREKNVEYFEVAVRDGDRRAEMEVTADGAIGEIESGVTLAELPQTALDAVEKATTGASERHLEHHEIRGVPRDGTFATVDPPVIQYEVSFKVNGQWKEIVIGADGRVFDSDDDTEVEEEDD